MVHRQLPDPPELLELMQFNKPELKRKKRRLESSQARARQPFQDEEFRPRTRFAVASRARSHMQVQLDARGGARAR